jgi:RND family efflux transporter MFP subunit
VGCNQAKPAAQAAKAIDVIVTKPVTGEVTDYQDFTGRLDAIKTVDIRARVSGYVIDVPFKEGDRVEAGHVLFRIDPRPYKAAFASNEAQVAACEAQIAVTESNLQLAKITLERARAAGTASTALEIDQDVSQAKVAKANLELAKANLGKARADLETARLNCEWTTVTAPISGRISRRNVDPGNLVNADNTALTTIVTEDPVYAYFDVDERTYLDLLETAAPTTSSPTTAPQAVAAAAAGQPSASPILLASAVASKTFPVLIRLANQTEFTQSGSINFIDNRVNSTTGTIRMRGLFENSKGNLKAGLFARVRLPIGSPYKAILVPDEALLSDQGRKYVYVVNGENKVEYRSVKIGQEIQGLRVIKEGLGQGDRVIISGMQRVRPDVTVAAKMQEPPKAPRSILVELLSHNSPAASQPAAQETRPANQVSPKHGG